MTKRSLPQLFKLGVLTSATLLALSAHASQQERKTNQQEKNNRHDDDDDRDNERGKRGLIALPTGQYVTPTAMKDAVPQFMNPQLAAYPNFVAGEAVRSRLSPDGTTLA